MELKLALYADDIVCFFRKPLESMNVLMCISSQFGNIAGYKINEDKSVLFGFKIAGELKKEILRIIPARSEDDGICYLGVQTFRSPVSMMKGNVNSLIDYIKEQCNIWSTYQLS